MSGGLYPAPLFEDGDFDIPSCYLSQEDGERLARYAGRNVKLEINSQRIPSQASNVIARKSSASGDGAAPFLLFTAHLDSKPTTPGALDNAAGVVTLLLLAELLKEDALPFDVEIVAFNGEEYYSAPGEVAYLKQVQPRLKSLRLEVNLDGLGYVEGATHFSTYNLSPEDETGVLELFARYPGLQPGPAWYQGDHTIFLQQGLPVIALTTQAFADAWSNFTHTPQDTPDKVNPAKLVEAAKALSELARRGVS
jgi:aminopeptidase YwaD